MEESKTCELCGNSFSCNPGGICWCSGVVTTPEKRELLSLVAKDCVCPECLSSIER